MFLATVLFPSHSNCGKDHSTLALNHLICEENETLQWNSTFSRLICFWQCEAQISTPICSMFKKTMQKKIWSSDAQTCNKGDFIEKHCEKLPYMSTTSPISIIKILVLSKIVMLKVCWNLFFPLQKLRLQWFKGANHHYFANNYGTKMAHLLPWWVGYMYWIS